MMWQLNGGSKCQCIWLFPSERYYASCSAMYDVLKQKSNQTSEKTVRCSDLGLAEIVNSIDTHDL